MKLYIIDFENEKFGIGINAESKEEAIKIAENPLNWKDGKTRKVSYIKEEE